jgi:DNA-binding CsgD family transcriptional regulator
LVGRGTELERIRRLLEDGGGASFVIAGEAGVGKTRLAHEAVAIAVSTGRGVRWVAGVRAASEIPFGAFAPLLPAPGPGLTGPSAYMREAARVMSSAGDGSPLLLAVDDAHALDAWSAALVHQLVATSRVGVVATVRHGEAIPDAVVSLWKDELATYLELEPLSAAEVGELLPAALEGHVAGATVRDLFEATRGNPLFLRVIVAEGLARGALHQTGGMWRWSGPVSGGGRLFEIIAQSVGRLEEGELDALVAISLGEPLDADSVRALSEPRALDSIQRRGLVSVAPSGRRIELRPAHPLYGESAGARIAPLRANLIRRRLAEAIEATGMRRREDVLRVAGWRLDAGGPHDADLMLRAATQAQSRHDLALTERLARAAERAGAGSRARGVLALAVLVQGRPEEAAELAGGRGVQPSSDAERVQLATIEGNALFFGLGRVEDADAAAAEAAGLTSDPDLRDELVAFRAAIRLFAGRPLEALALTEPVFARDGVSTRAAVRAALTALPAAAVSGRTDRGISIARRWLHGALELERDNPQWATLFLVSSAACRLFAGELVNAVSECERRYQDALARRAEASTALWAYMLGRAMLATGRVRTAQRWLREAAVLMREEDEVGFLPVVLACLAQASALSGASRDAEAAVEEAVAMRRPGQLLFDPDIGLAQVWLAASRGEASSARERALEVAARAAEAGMFGWAMVALHDVARLGAPGRVLDRLAAVAKEIDGCLAPLYVESASALRAGDGGRLDRVAERFDSIGATLLAAESASGAAAAQLAAGDRTGSLAASAKAAAFAGRCEGAITPGLTATAPAALLSVREREIAGLAAAGLTSAAIAEKLVLSRRTVESHLYHAFRKLGVSDRAQLAVALGLPERQPNNH